MGKKGSLLRYKESGYPISVVERHPAPSVPVCGDDSGNSRFNSRSGLKEVLKYKNYSKRVTFPPGAINRKMLRILFPHYSCPDTHQFLTSNASSRKPVVPSAFVRIRLHVPREPEGMLK